MDTIEPDVNAGNWQISTLERLSGIARELTACLDPVKVYQLLDQQIHTLLHPHGFSVYLLDETGHTLHCTHGTGQQSEAAALAVSDPASFIARCLREGSQILHDPAQTSRASSHEYNGPGLYLPMRSGERIIGVMAIHTLQAHGFGQREQMIGHSLCTFGSIALVNATTCQKLALATAVQQEPHATQAMSGSSPGLKSGFLADMSHEIRNPINAILGMAHLALRTDLDLRQQGYINKIHRAGLSLLGLINDILDFSKIEAGKLEMEAVPFSLDEVLNNVASVTSQRAAEKQLEYWFNIAPDVPAHCIGDPLRLSQILINLVNHAIKFTDSGEIELAIKLVHPANPALAAAGQRIRLEIAVSDSGGAMSPARLENLFQPFSQADGSGVRKQGGTGLGLSISRQLVHMMGSTLAVRNAADQGSSFYFELELTMAAADNLSPALPGALTAGRILLVDDNPHALQAVASMLQARSLRVSTAPSGIAGLRAMIAADQAHDPYSLVLTDWHMPKMSGIELRKRLAERPAMIEGSPPAMPQVVLLGGFGREQELPDLEQAGFAAMWCKPMSQSCLLNNLCALYENAAESTCGGTPPAISFAGASVLLAEDNDINQQIAVELLGTVGIRVDIANTGVEAVEKLLAAGEHGYSAILMDLEMPEMNGHQASLRIRSEKRFDDLPIIAMTAHTMAEMREQCAREGMQDYLTKPIHPEQLFQTLARWIKLQ